MKSEHNTKTTSRIPGFLEHARSNELESIQSNLDILSFLDRIDNAFESIMKTRFTSATMMLPAVLFLNSYASFLGAIRIALSGQAPLVSMALRGTLESALYSLIAGDSPENEAVWLDRIKGEVQRRRCSSLYTAKQGRAILKPLDATLEKRYKHAYEELIELGGHPNPLSILRLLGFREGKEQAQIMSLEVLCDPGDTGVTGLLFMCADAGVTVLYTTPYALSNHPLAGKTHGEARGIHQDLMAFAKNHDYLKAAFLEE